jgi:hypothetical protein
MSSNPPKRPERGSKETGRIFADVGGRLWNASLTSVKGTDTIVFICVSEARQPTRALSVEGGFDLTAAAEVELQRLLEEAPRVRPIE